MNEESYKDSTLIMQLLRDNLVRSNLGIISDGFFFLTFELRLSGPPPRLTLLPSRMRLPLPRRRKRLRLARARSLLSKEGVNDSRSRVLEWMDYGVED